MESTLARGELAPVHRGVIPGFAAFGVTLGLLTIPAVLLEVSAVRPHPAAKEARRGGRTPSG